MRHLWSIFRQEFLLHSRNYHRASTSIFFAAAVVTAFSVVRGLRWARALWLQTAAAALHCSAQGSHCEHGLQGMRGSGVWHTGLVASRVESSQTRDRTRFPCIGRHILNHWTTREVHHYVLNDRTSVTPQHHGAVGAS